MMNDDDPLDLTNMPVRLGTRGSWLWSSLGPLVSLREQQREAFFDLCQTYEVRWLARFTHEHVHAGTDHDEMSVRMVADFDAKLTTAAAALGIALETIEHLESTGPDWRKSTQH